jgi:oxaloacetate decarboxylase alpha subunit
MSKVMITETVLRDAHQSLIATRLSTKEMIPVLKRLDQVGYHALEMWGGATFDASLRYLGEDPWERLRVIRRYVTHTKLQMLLRGQNLLGYHHYPDDVVREFVKKSIENGIDIIRIFDALNDPRNMKVAMESAHQAGGHVQAAICYTTSPVHTPDTFVNLAVTFAEMGADSIAIKDMSGLLKPYTAFEIVSKIKKNVDLPLEVHSHATSGLASMMYLKAVEAGADIIDTAISPFALGTSQPPTESIVATLMESEYDTGIDLGRLSKIAEHFAPLREKYLESGVLNKKVLGVNINTLLYQVPGGMLSNLVSQLKVQKALNRFDEVLKEVPRVRAELGYPPLVTPTSQIIGTQAVLNVISGERYKIIPKEVKEYVKGKYGRPTVPIKKDIVKMIIGDEDLITCRPGDLIAPALESLKEEVKEYLEKDEDLLTYALFPNIAIEYFKYRDVSKYKIDEDLVNIEDMTYPV